MSILSRKKSRKFLFQKLYSDSFSKNNNSLFEEAFLIDSFTWSLDFEYIYKMEELILKNEQFLIYIIKKYADKFEIKDMSIIYILPIFIWTCEMLFLDEEIPAKISINESIEISKVYWWEHSNKIVNWVLDKIFINIDQILLEKDKFIINNKDFSFFC